LEFIIQNANLSYNCLTELPKEIGNLTQLITLNIRRLGLIKLPKEIGNLVNLNHLNCEHNNLTELPKEIGNLVNLTKLKLYDNKLTELPKEIGNLVNLTKLRLYDNNLTELPKEIGNLQNLTELNFSRCGNKLTELPKVIFKLKNLESLCIGYNNLTALPKEIGNLVNLTDLYCHNNNLTELPKEIGNLVNLTDLYCINNNLTELPKEIGNLVNLTDFKLTNNKLTELPKEIGNLINLENLCISDNKLTELPLEIINLRLIITIRYDNNPIENLLHPIIHRFLNNLNKMKPNKSIYDDNQNVHSSSIQQSIKDSIFNLMKYYKTDYILKYLDNDILTENTMKALVEYSASKEIHSIMNITFEELLKAVFIEIELFDIDKQKEIFKIMNQEMNDSICMCFTGRISRLINCLNGFSEKVSVNISTNEEISNIIITLKNKIHDIDELKKTINKELLERGYSHDIITEWLKYVE
jgi:Leucine-rich repeat (LRR) protein